jgi:hypothetical protein
MYVADLVEGPAGHPGIHIAEQGAQSRRSGSRECDRIVQLSSRMHVYSRRFGFQVTSRANLGKRIGNSAV